MREKDPGKIEAIYNATLKLVLREGFAGLKMSEVAKEAGVATGTLYIYFESKEELINQLYLEKKKKSVGQYFKGIDAGAPFMVCFEQLWYNYARTGLAEPEVAAFMEQYYRSPFLRPAVKQETDQLLTPIFELLERGKRERLLKDLPTPLLAIQLNGTINEMVRWHASGQATANDELLSQAFGLAWDAIKR